MPDEGTDNPTPGISPGSSPGNTPEPTPGPGPTKKVLTPSAETKPAMDKKSKKDRPEPTTFGGKLWHNWVKPVGSVILIVVVVRSMLIDWNDVPTGSMEPEIAVGDRIAVNRLAYGLQFPLTGPQIGIPFIGPQFDNPLDGIPQINWGNGPARGDIVTFWNPVTKVRMVKRIVAIPGDTIAMNGGVMTINGTAATYVDVDAAAEGLPAVTKFGDKTVIRKDLVYQREELLGETRIVQYIMERWLDETQIVELHDGSLATLTGGLLAQYDVLNNKRNTQFLDKYLLGKPRPTVIADFRAGEIYIDDKPASYNNLAELLLARFEDGDRAEVLAKIDLSTDGHMLLLEGNAVSMDIFEQHLKAKAAGALSKEDSHTANQMLHALNVLGNLTMTNFGPITLDKDEYFMVGDNRNNSHDSRRFGPVKRSEITGEAFAVAFSFKDNKMFTMPPEPDMSRWFKDLD